MIRNTLQKVLGLDGFLLMKNVERKVGGGKVKSSYVHDENLNVNILPTALHRNMQTRDT